MVEGFFRASSDNRDHDPFQIAKDIACGDSKRSEAAIAQIFISNSIMRHLIGGVVDRAVDFDRQTLRQAGKIKTIGSNRVLAPEFLPARPRLERVPQANLGRIARTTILARGFDDGSCRVEDPSTRFHLVPLPVPGRFFVAVLPHILNTPKLARSGIGAFKHAANARPSTSRVCAGSMMPSSHSRAVACHGLPWAS